MLWNDHATALFGYSSEDMMGESLRAIVPERFRDLHSTGVERVAGGGERHVIGSTVELAGLDHAGREFPIELSLATWSADGEQLFIGIIRDITERKRAEEQLHLANKALNEKNEQLEGLSSKLAKYLSRQVYDSIFAGRTEVRVESYRKELTVFFSDSTTVTCSLGVSSVSSRATALSRSMMGERRASPYLSASSSSS